MNDRAESLVSEMLADPQRFDGDGKAHDLLQCYFAGSPLETLLPMLTSGNVYLQRGAAFIASELGEKATPLIDHIIPLVEAADRHTQWYAMEVLVVCGKGPLAEKFLAVVRLLDSGDSELRGLAGRLMSRADASQLDVARGYFEDRGRFDDVRRWRAGQHPGAVMARPTWGDLVRIKSNAPPEWLPGHLASVCGVREVETAEHAKLFDRPKGTRVLLVELSDGSAHELPEDLLEIVNE